MEEWEKYPYRIDQNLSVLTLPARSFREGSAFPVVEGVNE